jgi:asparagine synthase (glutamine-hydrolysing)
MSANFSQDDTAQILRAMTAELTHRGPDDAGTWIDAEAGVALGHRRLSILDLSPHGAQPMQSACGRYVISYNGEIYNFDRLRAELEGAVAVLPAWRGHSDTEVMLAAISHWGLEKAVERLVGMFAFALWDRRERTLFLVRDRLGEKPLYYGWLGGTLVFASELKALKRHPSWRGDIDRDALALLLRHNYIPAPHSIYKHIRKLPPGTWLRITPGAAAGALEPHIYWSAREVAERGTRGQLSLSRTEAVQHLDPLLRESVKQQMVADVPLGAFLSGGIDSSTVVALMQAQSTSRVKTFTIGFREAGYDEAPHAQAVATHLGTDHTELYVSPEEAMATIPRLPRMYDEPFSDSSQIPTFLVAQLARKHVTVSLSGDGGDELFAGYNRYFWGRSIWQRIGWIPAPLRAIAAPCSRCRRHAGRRYSIACRPASRRLRERNPWRQSA